MAARATLYERLELDSAASAEDVKRAYRRLALQFHPDKNPGHETDFQEIGKAYQILSTPSKRKIYDQYGEMGLEILGHVNSTTLTEFLLNTPRLKLLFAAIFSILAFVLCFPFFLAFKVSGTIVWPWYVVFLPLWTFDLAVLSIGSLLLFLSWNILSSQQEGQPTEQDSASNDVLNKSALIATLIWLFLIVTLLFTQKALVAFKLDGLISWSWWSILSPYLAIESVRLVWTMLSMYYVVARWSQTGEQASEQPSEEILSREDREMPHAKLYYIFRSLRWIVMRLSFTLLLISKISGYTSWSWALVLSPLYLFLTLSFLLDLHADTRKAHSAMAYYTSDQGPSPKKLLAMRYIPYSIGTFAVLLFLLLLNLRLLSDPSSSPIISWTLVFMPVYIAASISLLLLSLLAFIWYLMIPSFASTQPQPMSDPEGVIITGTSAHNGATTRETRWLEGSGYIFGPSQHRIRRSSAFSIAPK